MTTKLYHFKSRTGCLQCKQRKVKVRIQRSSSLSILLVLVWWYLFTGSRSFWSCAEYIYAGAGPFFLQQLSAAFLSPYLLSLPSIFIYLSIANGDCCCCYDRSSGSCCCIWNCWHGSDATLTKATKLTDSDEPAQVRWSKSILQELPATQTFLFFPTIYSFARSITAPATRPHPAISKLISDPSSLSNYSTNFINININAHICPTPTHQCTI